jgi:putative DNA primase/helicase
MYSNNAHQECERIAEIFQLKATRQGGFKGQCPLCGYPDTFDLKAEAGKVLLYCHACQAPFGAFLQYFQSLDLGQASKPYKAMPQASLAKVSHPNKQETLSIAEGIWEASQALEGTLAERYLASRGITLKKLDSLRFHPSLKNTESRLYLPALVAKISTEDGVLTGIHRTYLAPDGKGKASVLDPKKMLGNTRGANIHLSPLTGDTLAVCEGIETGLSILQMTGIPTWVCLSTGGMVSLEIPKTIRTLLICGDNDPAGITASLALKARAIEEGYAVKYITPKEAGFDFNDVLQKEMTQ